jgi:oligosaccharyltransferase complex subunit beta
MLDPYIRTTLKQAPSSSSFGRFQANVRLPDVYGVFTLKVNYKRAGLSYILAEDQVSIRPFRHNEYPRFLTAAYPYYASTYSMIVGFLVFSAVWLSTWGGKSTTTTTTIATKKTKAI